MKVITITPSTARDSYMDSDKKKEIKTFFDSSDLKDGDVVIYGKTYPFNLLRREGESHRFDVFYCAPGSSEFEEHGEFTLKVKDREYHIDEDEMVQLITEEHFESLVVGQRITRVSDDRSRGLRVVGRMPGSPVYIILSDGEHLEHLYIPNHVKTTTTYERGVRWFKGKYDTKKVGAIMLQNLDRRKESVEKIYIED